MIPLALDVSRLLWRAIRKAPGGIDRFELAMAQHLLREEPTARFVFTDGGAIRIVKPAAMRRLTQAAASRWAGKPEDSGCRRVAAYLRGDDRGFPLARARWTDSRVVLTDLVRSTVAGFLYHRNAFEDGSLEELDGAAYVNLSHRNLDHPALHTQLARFSRVLCHLHDDIAFRHPRFAVPGADEGFCRMMRNLARRDVRIVTASAASRSRIIESMTSLGLPLAPVEVLRLPVAEVFSAPPTPLASGRSFFLLPGLMTARKNIGLILQACRQMDRTAGGFDVVLAGAPGLDATRILADLDQAPQGIRFVRAEGLSDHAMALLARGARAVLAPSLEEGFDYPLHEALTAGVPVLASDIAVHREYGEGFAELLDPSDPSPWAAALGDFTEAASPRRLAALAAARRFSSPTPAQLLRQLAALARSG